MQRKPEILTKKVVAESKLFKIEEMHLRFANGQERVFERMQGGHRGSVMVVPLQDDDTVLLIREYAAGVDGYELGLVKGLMEENESLLDAANRELMEEIGFAAKSLTVLTTMTVSPSYFAARTTIVLARDLYQERLIGDEPEEIEVVPWKLSELEHLLQRPDFSEARSIAALYWVRDLVQRG